MNGEHRGKYQANEKEREEKCGRKQARRTTLKKNIARERERETHTHTDLFDKRERTDRCLIVYHGGKRGKDAKRGGEEENMKRGMVE